MGGFLGTEGAVHLVRGHSLKYQNTHSPRKRVESEKKEAIWMEISRKPLFIPLHSKIDTDAQAADSEHKKKYPVGQIQSCLNKFEEKKLWSVGFIL